MRFLIGLALAWLSIGAVSPAAAQRWHRAESPHFIIYSDAGEGQLRRATRAIEGFDAILRRLMQPPQREFESKLEVYVFRSRSGMTTARPGLGEDVAGFYMAHPEIVATFAYTLSSDSAFASQEILFHEYAHHFMLSNFANTYPGWYVEGLAEFVQTIDIRGERALLGTPSMMRAPWLANGDWMPIRDLLASNVSAMSRTEIAQFYAQSWLAVHYLQTNQERWQGFRRYIARLRAGEDVIEAFEPAFGITPEAFQSELRRYARAAIPRYELPIDLLRDADIATTQLSDSSGALMALSLRLRMGVREAEMADLARRVEAAAARHPTDAFAQRTRARAQILNRQYAEARALLESVIAADESDLEAHYLLGYSHIEEALEAEGPARAEIAARARRPLARAARINPDHAPTLYRYAQSFLLSGAPMPDNALETLLKAHLLAPQVSEIAVNAAVSLMNVGDFAAAANMLRPIAHAPHGGEEREQLRALLEQAEQQARAAE